MRRVFLENVSLDCDSQRERERERERVREREREGEREREIGRLSLQAFSWDVDRQRNGEGWGEFTCKTFHETLCVCVCVCVWEREREGGREGGRESALAGCFIRRLFEKEKEGTMKSVFERGLWDGDRPKNGER